jgi:hypothetical protein
MNQKKVRELTSTRTTMRSLEDLIFGSRQARIK